MKVKWIKFSWLYFLISAIVLLPGIYSLFKWGVKPAIDFTGGTLLELKGEGLNNDLISRLAGKMELNLESQRGSEANSHLLRFSQLGEDKKNELITALEKEVENIEIIRWETLGPALGRELLIKTGVGIILAVLAILVYINFQFKDKCFGICAILAMLHDSLILLGGFSLLGHFLDVQIDGLFVTAILTTLSTSVHDTVVVFDRLRELSKIYPKLGISEIANQAISQTLTRSINNSLTIIFMLVALVWLGGETTRWFAAALLIGTTAGTYSSTFIAVPLLVVWKKIFTGKE